MPGTKDMLLGRGYKPAMLKDAFKYGLELDRDESLKKVARENKTEIWVRYTITFDPKPAPLPSILVKNWKVMLDLDQRLKHLFPAPPMTCLKRGPNLADELIRAKVPRPPKQCATRAAVTGFRSCKGGRIKCSLCPFSGAASDGKTIIQEVKIHHSGEIIQIKEIITCKDSFIKYILTCTKPGCIKQINHKTSLPEV